MAQSQQLDVISEKRFAWGRLDEFDKLASQLIRAKYYKDHDNDEAFLQSYGFRDRSKIANAERKHRDTFAAFSEMFWEYTELHFQDVVQTIENFIEHLRFSYEADTDVDAFGDWLALWIPFAVIKPSLAGVLASRRIPGLPAEVKVPTKVVDSAEGPVVASDYQGLALEIANNRIVGSSPVAPQRDSEKETGRPIKDERDLRAAISFEHPIFLAMLQSVNWETLADSLDPRGDERVQAIRAAIDNAFAVLDASKKDFANILEQQRSGDNPNWKYVSFIIDGAIKELHPTARYEKPYKELFERLRDKSEREQWTLSDVLGAVALGVAFVAVMIAGAGIGGLIAIGIDAADAILVLAQTYSKYQDAEKKAPFRLIDATAAAIDGSGYDDDPEDGFGLLDGILAVLAILMLARLVPGRRILSKVTRGRGVSRASAATIEPVPPKTTGSSQPAAAQPSSSERGLMGKGTGSTSVNGKVRGTGPKHTLLDDTIQEPPARFEAESTVSKEIREISVKKRGLRIRGKKVDKVSRQAERELEGAELGSAAHKQANQRLIKPGNMSRPFAS
jgi:hypothetical protein